MWSRSKESIQELATTEQCDALFKQDLTILFKHSPTCPVSLYAHREVSRFCANQPNAPVYLISVRRHRELARHVAEKTGVRHESPQILVLRQGEVVAVASHDEISAELLQSFLTIGQRKA